MDEAGRCDRVALIQKGRILEIDRPAAIGDRYPLPLLVVAGSGRLRLVAALRGFPHARTVYPFGDALHYTDARAGADPEAVAAELRAYLAAGSFADAEVAPIRAGIEDAFMALMGTEGRP
jgi:hypothetical protein